MLTYQDCADYSGLTAEEIEFLARHYRLPEIVALEVGQRLLDDDAGLDEFEHMIADDLECCWDSRELENVRRLARLLSHFVADHPHHRH